MVFVAAPLRRGAPGAADEPDTATERRGCRESSDGSLLRSLPDRVLFTIVFLIAVALSGCGRNTATTARRAGELVFNNAAEPETLDPALITRQSDQRICYALFEGLTSYTAKAELQPGVAERWEVSPDGLRYTFYLRPDAVWSNGRRITAEDFVGSWRRTLAPETAGEYASLLYPIANARAFNEGESKDFSQVGVRALAPDTLEVRLENPTPFFLGLTATSPYCPVPLPEVQRWGEGWTKPEHIVTNGAFLLRAWRLNDRIRLEKNPRYWNAAAVRLPAVDVLPIARANTALNFFAGGLVDLFMDKDLIPPSLTATIRRRPEFHASPFLGNYFFRFNCQRPPFNDPRVRQAFCLVVDKRAIVEKITQAGETPATSFVPPDTGPGYQPPPGPGYDPERARRLLAEAGYPGGERFPNFAYLYKEGDLDEAIGIELQGMFRRELGVNMALRRQEAKVYNGSMSSLDYDLARSSWIGDYNDPNTFLNLWVTDDGNNRTGWGDPAYDQLIADVTKESDQAKRFALFQRAERTVVSEQAIICPLYYYLGVQMYDPKRVGGIEPNLLDEHPLKAMYLKEP